MSPIAINRPGLILPQRRLAKPKWGVRLIRSHPHARGLRAAILLNEGGGNYLHDLAEGRILSQGNFFGQYEWVPGADGPALQVDGQSNNEGFRATDGLRVGAHSWLAGFKFIQSDGDNILWAESNNILAGGFEWAIKNTSGGVLEFAFYSGGVKGWFTQSTNIIPAGEWGIIGATWDLYNFRSFRNGTFLESKATGAGGLAPTYTASDTFALWLQGNNRPVDSALSFMYVWDRVLSDEEMGAITARPFSMWAEPGSATLFLVSSFLGGTGSPTDKAASDAGAGSEAVAVEVLAPAAEPGSGGEGATAAAELAGGDAGAAGDTAAAAADAPAGDVGAAQEATQLAATVPAAEAGTGGEAAITDGATPKSAGDAGVGGDGTAPAAEDFAGDYTENDPEGVFTVSGGRITFTNVERDETGQVVRDFGAGHFSGDFLIRFKLVVTAGASFAQLALAAFTNAVEKFVTGGNDGLCVFLAGNGGNFRLDAMERDAGTSYTDNGTFVAPGTVWVEFVRDETVGTYGTIYVRTYSDEFVTLLQERTLALHSSKKDFRFFSGACGVGIAANPGADLDGYLEDVTIGAATGGGVAVAGEIPAAETGAAGEAAAAAADIPAGETGTGGDDASLDTIEKAASEAAEGQETPGLAAAVPAAESGAGEEAASAAAAAAAGDAGTGEDAATASQSTSTSETASGGEVLSLAAALSLADPGAAGETAALVASVAVSEAGAGQEAVLAEIPKVAADAGLGQEVTAVAVTRGVSDPSAGQEVVQFVAALTLADPADGAEAAALVATLVLEDPATGGELASLLADLAAAEAGAGGEEIFLAVARAVADVAAGLDAAVIAGAIARDLSALVDFLSSAAATGRIRVTATLLRSQTRATLERSQTTAELLRSRTDAHLA